MIEVYYSKELYDEALMYVQGTLYIWSDEVDWKKDTKPTVKELKEYVKLFDMDVE